MIYVGDVLRRALEKTSLLLFNLLPLVHVVRKVTTFVIGKLFSRRSTLPLIVMRMDGIVSFLILICVRLTNITSTSLTKVLLREVVAFLRLFIIAGMVLLRLLTFVLKRPFVSSGVIMALLAWMVAFRNRRPKCIRAP